MCYQADINSDFHWRKVEGWEDPCIDHTYLVSDGSVIGMCSYTICEGKALWETIRNDDIETTTYYGGDVEDIYGNISKDKIKVEDIKYWCPIPVLPE